MKLPLQRIYIDTSVVGGYFDVESSNDSKKFFERVRKREVIIIISSLLEDELMDAPEKVRNLIKHFPSAQVEKVKLSKIAMNLAEKYIEAKVVGKTSVEDCRHIAVATICKADILVSWNFKHIVNVERINGYSSVNLKQGYNALDIRTPKESLHHEED